MDQDSKHVQSTAQGSRSIITPSSSLPNCANDLPTTNGTATRDSISTSTTLNSHAKHRSPSMFRFRRKRKNDGAAFDTGIPPATKDKHNIDPTDGKTMACNRAKTFDTFLDGERLGVDTEQKKTGHTWELARGLGRLMGRLRESVRKDTKGGRDFDIASLVGVANHSGDAGQAPKDDGH